MKQLLQTINRFFEPVYTKKRYYIHYLFTVLARPFYGIITTLFLAKAVGYIQNPDKDAFFLIVGIYAIFTVLYQIYNYFGKNSGGWFIRESFKNIYPKYFSRFIKMDGNSFEKVGTGKMSSIITKGIDTRQDLLMQTGYLGICAIVELLFVTYLMTKITRYSPLILYIFLIVIIIIVAQLARKANSRREKRNDMVDELSRQETKIIMSKIDILLNNKINLENNKYINMLDEAKNYDTRKQVYEHIGFNVPTLGIALITVSLFLVLGYKFFFEQAISYADIVLYLGLINSLENGTRDAIDLYKTFSKNFQRVTKLWDIFDTIPEIKGYEKGKKFRYEKGDIVFHDVTFRYNEKDILHDFSLSIQGGKKTALVGQSGSGKSTLVKLIAGYLHATSGTITVDKQQLPTESNLDESIALQSYYTHIGYLTQEPSVFDGTIIENLTYAVQEDVTQDQIDQAITRAQCEFVYEFADKLNTEIGEKGIRLSGGQRQRLAIAKIFLKNPEIIILDEPTSALDSFSEEKISQALHELFKDRTVIIIAHRLQTVKQADDIIVLEEGKIMERGNHDTLIAHNGIYKKMLDLQSGI